MNQLKDNQKIRKSLKILIKTHAFLKTWSKFANRSKDRYFRLRQLVTTQQLYRQDLITLRDKIMLPLLQQQIITQQQSRRMFANIPNMIIFSQSIQADLNQKFRNWDRRTTTIGKQMQPFAKFLPVYADYFNNLPYTQQKIKLLLQEQKKVKQIESKLSKNERIITIQDLLSKPFQRPLKYHLILRDYRSKLPSGHPDQIALDKAIKSFHQNNQKNNEQMINKQKQRILIELNKRFGNVVQQQIRSFVNKFEAIMIDTGVQIFLFSNLIIISFKSNQKEHIRIVIDKHSFIQKAQNNKYFQNRVFLYGKRICVHLSFMHQPDQIQFQKQVKKVIAILNDNEQARAEKILQLVDRNSRKSIVERRRSFTSLQPQTKKPFIARVLGIQKRYFSPDNKVIYFVIQITTTQNSNKGQVSPSQISIVPIQKIYYLQKLIRRFYPDIYCRQITTCPKGFTQFELRTDQQKRLQLQCMFIQLFLNTLFRDALVIKRLDIVAYFIKMSQPIWLYLRDPDRCQISANNKEQCGACKNIIKYNNYRQYFDHLTQRRLQKYSKSQIYSSGVNVKVFCDTFTIKMARQFQKLLPQTLKDALLQEKLTYVKTKNGSFNYRYTNSIPIFKRTPKNILMFDILKYNYVDKMEIQFAQSQTVRHIRDFIGQRLSVNLQDFTLVAYLDLQYYTLMDDEYLSDVVCQKQQTSFFGGFFKKQPYQLKLCLRKLWYLSVEEQLKCQPKKLYLKMQQIMFRLKSQQLKLKNLKHYGIIYAIYYIFKHFIQLNALTRQKIQKSQDFKRMLPPRLNKQCQIYIFQQIQKIKNTNPSQQMLAKKIIEEVYSIPQARAYYYNVIDKTYGYKIRLGCGDEGLFALQQKSIYLNLSFQKNNWTCQLNCQQIWIETTGADMNKQIFVFQGKDVWKIKKQIDIYRSYKKLFTK